VATLRASAACLRGIIVVAVFFAVAASAVKYTRAGYDHGTLWVQLKSSLPPISIDLEFGIVAHTDYIGDSEQNGFKTPRVSPESFHFVHPQNNAPVFVAGQMYCNSDQDIGMIYDGEQWRRLPDTERCKERNGDLISPR
jgi:hypothetical protein